MPYAAAPQFGSVTSAAPAAFDLNESVTRNAAKHGVDPNLVHALIKQESGGQQGATSSKGARGIMQLMPGTAAELGVDMNDPEQNVEGGIRYLGQMLNRYGGDVEKGLAAYNAGPGTVDKYGGVPPYKETREHVDNVKRMSAALMGPQPQVEPQLVGPPAPEVTAPKSRYQPAPQFTRFDPTEHIQREAIANTPDATVPPPPEKPWGSPPNWLEQAGTWMEGVPPVAAQGAFDVLKGAARGVDPIARNVFNAIQGTAGTEFAAPPLGELPGLEQPQADTYFQNAVPRTLETVGAAVPTLLEYGAGTIAGGPILGFGGVDALNAALENQADAAMGREPERSVAGAAIKGSLLGAGFKYLPKVIPGSGVAPTVGRGAVAAGTMGVGLPLTEGRSPQLEDLVNAAALAPAAAFRGGRGAKPLEGPATELQPLRPDPSQRALPEPPRQIPDLRGDVIHGQDLRGQSGPPIDIPPGTRQIEGANPAQRQIPDLRSQVIQGEAPLDRSLAVPQETPQPRRDITRNPTAVSPEVLPLTGPPELAPGPYLPGGEPLIGFKGPRTSDRATTSLTEQPARPEQTAAPLEVDPVRAAAAELTAAQKATAAAEKAYNKSRSTANADALRAASAAEQAVSAKLQGAMRGYVVYHGTTEKFDHYNVHKQGVGAGGDLYGRGIYLSDNPDVAGGYANRLKEETESGYVRKQRIPSTAKLLDAENVTPSDVERIIDALSGGILGDFKTHPIVQQWFSRLKPQNDLYRVLDDISLLKPEVVPGYNVYPSTERAIVKAGWDGAFYPAGKVGSKKMPGTNYVIYNTDIINNPRRAKQAGGRNATQEGVQPRNEVSQYPRDEGSGTPTEPVRSGSNEPVRQEPTQVSEPTPPSSSQLGPSGQVEPPRGRVQGEESTMTFEQFEQAYRTAFKKSMEYTPDQVGSKHYTEQLADLEAKNPIWADAIERRPEYKGPFKAGSTTLQDELNYINVRNAAMRKEARNASRMQDVRENARPTEAQGQSAPQGKGQSSTQSQREGAAAPYDAKKGNDDVATRRTPEEEMMRRGMVKSGTEEQQRARISTVDNDNPTVPIPLSQLKRLPEAALRHRMYHEKEQMVYRSQQTRSYMISRLNEIYKKQQSPSARHTPEAVDADIARLQEVRDSDAPASERRKAERQLEKLYEEYNKLVEEESGRALNPGQLVDKVLSKFRSRGDLPRDLDRLVQQRKGQLNAADRGIEFALIDLDRAMRKTYGRKPTPANIDLMRAVLEGRAAVTQLPTELQGPMTALRKGDVGIDTLSDYMVQNNLVTGDLAKTISQNTGKYTHREYRAFDTPNWEDILRRDNPTVVNTAKAEIRKANLARWQAAGKTPKQINELVEGAFIRLVNKGDAKNLNEFMNAKLGHEDLGFLKQRKNLPDWVRKALGEYEDPRAIYATSASGASHFIVNKKFLDAVKQVGFDKYFHSEPVVKGDTRYTEKLGNKAVFGDLADLYTTKEIKAEFENAFEPREMSKMVRGILAANGVVKYGATIGNVPQGYVRNATSNPLLVLANGNINPVHAPKTFKVMASRLFDRGSTATRKEEMRLVRLGVLGDSANFGEFRAAINDVVGHSRSVNDFQHNALVRAAKYTGHTLTRWWAAIDDVFKAFNFYSEEAKYRKAYPNWTPEQVARKAAELTSAQMPTYSRAPKIVQTLRHNPVIAPFATFPAEVTRNTFNIAYQAAKEIRDPATRSIGLQRAAGLTAAIAAAATIDQMSQEQAGISDQDVKDLRKFMPPYSKDAPIMWLGKDANGNQKYVDMTYMAPHTILTKPLKAAMDEGTPLEKVENMLKTGLEPYYSPELLPQRIWQAAKNDSPRIYNPEDTRAGIAMDVGKYVGEAFIPGAGKAARRIKQAATGEVGPSGQQYNLGDELTSTFTGARKQRVDVLRSLSFKASEYTGTKSNTTRLFTDTAKSKQAVTKEELKGDYAKSTKQKQARFDEIVDLARAAIRLGHPAKDVIKSLTEGGIGKEEALYILLNQQPKYTPSQDALMDSYKAGGTERLIDTITATVGEQ